MGVRRHDNARHAVHHRRHARRVRDARAYRACSTSRRSPVPKRRQGHSTGRHAVESSRAAALPVPIRGTGGGARPPATSPSAGGRVTRRVGEIDPRRGYVHWGVTSRTRSAGLECNCVKRTDRRQRRRLSSALATQGACAPRDADGGAHLDAAGAAGDAGTQLGRCSRGRPPSRAYPQHCVRASRCCSSAARARSRRSARAASTLRQRGGGPSARRRGLAVAHAARRTSAKSRPRSASSWRRSAAARDVALRAD